MRRVCSAFNLACYLTAIILLASPVSQAHDDHEEKASNKVKAATIGQALILPEIKGPKPWSSKPILTDEDRFSIAIMTDRTGGHRPGIWMKAVNRVNWLRPEFVVSVGDLIEGYTDDQTEIDRQWQEFIGFIDKMEMKFFFVAGNHDVTNPTLHRNWRERFGPEWYSFDFKGVHFVCLSSEDPSAKIGEDQLEWLETDLEENAAAKWTLVFLHKPLWTYAERELAAGNDDPTNWKRVEALLVDRPHTVFAGHVHHYVQYQRNGQQYYSLATTGGGSRLRGIDHGEFDHITWLTMEKDGPHVANLLLDGIQPAEVVTESSIRSFQQFLSQVRIEVAPILISGDALQHGEIQITIYNNNDSEIVVDADVLGLPLVGLDMESQSIQMAVIAGASSQKTIPFSMKEKVELERFRLTSMLAKVRSKGEEPLKAEWSVPVIVDHEYRIYSEKVVIDGDLADWSNVSWWSTDETPVLAGESKNWNGTKDSSFQLAARYGEGQIYFAAKVRDEKVELEDALTVAVDPRPLLSRLSRNRLSRETIAATISAPESTELTSVKASLMGQTASIVDAKGRRVDGGYELEFAVPLRNVIDAQGKDWSNIQIGARLADVDEPNEKPVEVLWRAAPNRFENRSFGHVIRY